MNKIGTISEPLCPEAGCGAGARRPKCFFELGAACPRHAVLRVWNAAKKAALAAADARVEAAFKTRKL